MSKKFTHLLVNGCSFAFSQNLETPQKWSYKTSTELGIPLILLAEPGASNDRIKRTTIDYLLRHQHLPKEQFNPLCIICFTQGERREEWNPNQNISQSVFFPYTLEEFEDYRGERQNEPFCEWSMALLRNLHRSTALWNLRKKYQSWYETSCCVQNMKYTCLTTDYFPEPDEILMAEFCADNLMLYLQISNSKNRLKDFEQLTRGMPTLECGHDGIEAQQVLADYLITAIKDKFTNAL